MTRSKSGSVKNLVDDLRIDGHPAASSRHFPFEIQSLLLQHLAFPPTGVRHASPEVEESRKLRS